MSKPGTIEIKLKQHSPLIHFQYDEKGAILRATEVKPRFDMFLSEKKVIDNNWYLNNEGTPSGLNYKMRIKVSEVQDVDIGQKTDYDIYYGNMNVDRKVKAIKAEGIIIEIICFIEELRKLIVDNIEEFFIVNNFGRMQSKGFGSFTVTEINGGKKTYSQDKIIESLRNMAGAKDCYYFESSKFKKTNKEIDNTFKRIKCIYMLMKSGINLDIPLKDGEKEKISDCANEWGGEVVSVSVNDRERLLLHFKNKKDPDIKKLYKEEKAGERLKSILHPSFKIKQSDTFYYEVKRQTYERSKLFEYMHESGIDNEKAALKESGKVSIKTTSPLASSSNGGNKNYKYVRSLLGVGEHILFKGYKKEQDVKVSIKQSDIERLSSPIFFKIIDNTVYYVGKRINSELLKDGIEFIFEKKEGEETEEIKKLEVPKVSEDFCDDFLDYCFERFKNELTFKKFIDLKNVNLKSWNETKGGDKS